MESIAMHAVENFCQEGIYAKNECYLCWLQQTVNKPSRDGLLDWSTCPKAACMHAHLTDIDYGEELRHVDQSYAAVNLHFSVTRRLDCWSNGC